MRWSKLGAEEPGTLQDEADIMKECRHPYAVGLLGYWDQVTKIKSRKVPFLLMESMECNLKHLLIDRNKKRWARSWVGTRGLPALDSINLMLPVAKALRHLHRMEVAHRDLKPENILYTSAKTQYLPEDFSVKLADFGGAGRAADAVVGAIVGTTGYTDPDVRSKRENVDLFKADVFSFGLVFGEVLTGLSPAEARHCTRAEAQKKFERGERPPLPKNTPGFVENIVRSCWASNPAARPSFEEICWMLQNTELLLRV